MADEGGRRPIIVIGHSGEYVLIRKEAAQP